MKLLMDVCALTVLAVAGAVPAQAQIELASALAQPHPAVSRAHEPGLNSPRATPEPRSAALNADERAFFDVLGHRLTNGAAAYESYVRQTSAIDPRFDDAGSIQSALRVAESYNPDQLREGAVAYAAVLALRSPAFVDGVRDNGDPALADRLIAQPEAVMRLPGAFQAAQDVSGVMQAQADAVKSAGHKISGAAYSVQHQAWSRRAVVEPEKVLALAKAAALRLAQADEISQRRLLDSISTAPSVSGARGATSSQVTRGLALAAVAILGRAGDAQESRFEPLLRELRDADCLQMARLNLNQCLAVAGPQYEDVFCLGQHAVGETAQCLVSAVDSGQSPQGVKTAELEGYGTERAEAYGDLATR